MSAISQLFYVPVLWLHMLRVILTCARPSSSEREPAISHICNFSCAHLHALNIQCSISSYSLSITVIQI